MAHYKNMKYPSLMFLSLCLSLNAFGATETLTSVEEEKGDIQPKRARLVPTADSKKELLLKHLPLQIEALEALQEKFRSVMNDQRDKNQLAAFKAACSLANLQALSSSVQDIIYCLKKEDNPDVISIGIGAAPGIKQEIDQLIVYLDEAHHDSSALKALVGELQKITGDIPNPEFPADSIL